MPLIAEKFQGLISMPTIDKFFPSEVALSLLFRNE